MISIAIDGPSGAGKSSLAKALAKDLGYVYVDTGAMYRSIGLYAVRAGVDPHDADAVAALLPQVKLGIRLIDGAQHIYLNGEDVSTAIRAEEIGMAASAVAAHPAVRSFLLDSWDSAGRVRLKVQPIGPTELQVPEEKVKLLRDTVSSLRLDSVLSVGFSLSRSKAAEAVTSGKVQVNWTDWQKPDRQVVQGDVLTLRGLGKCVLEEVGNQTKKGRVFITVKRYL